MLKEPLVLVERMRGNDWFNPWVKSTSRSQSWRGNLKTFGKFTMVRKRNTKRSILFQVNTIKTQTLQALEKNKQKKQTIIMQQVCFFLHILLMQLSYPPLNLFQPTFRWPDIMRKLLLHPCASPEATDYGKRPISGCYAIIRELEKFIYTSTET